MEPSSILTTSKIEGPTNLQHTLSEYPASSGMATTSLPAPRISNSRPLTLGPCSGLLSFKNFMIRKYAGWKPTPTTWPLEATITALPSSIFANAASSSAGTSTKQPLRPWTGPFPICWSQEEAMGIECWNCGKTEKELSSKSIPAPRSAESLPPPILLKYLPARAFLWTKPSSGTWKEGDSWRSTPTKSEFSSALSAPEDST